jgi:hypothetical protein
VEPGSSFILLCLHLLLITLLSLVAVVAVELTQAVAVGLGDIVLLLELLAVILLLKLP